MIGASRTGGLSARFTGSKCRSRVWISLFAKPILARVADPIVGRTYERKRSDRRSPNLSLQVGGRPHMNRGRANLKVALHVGLGGWSSEHVRIGVDEGQVLALLLGEALSAGAARGA